MSQTDTPITDHGEIVKALKNVKPGDELTVEAESGYTDNRDVVEIDENYITFGNPRGPGRVLDAETGTVLRITDEPQPVFKAGDTITALWQY